MQRVKRLTIAALLAVATVLGVGAVAAPAQAITSHYMNCTHPAYRYSTFEDHTPGGNLSRPQRAVNYSGHTQYVRTYSYSPGVGWVFGGWIAVPSGGQHNWQNFPFGSYQHWSLQWNDGNTCAPYYV